MVDSRTLRLPGVDSSFEFADLNIRHTGSAERTLKMVQRLVRMGYDCCAINLDIGDPYAHSVVDLEAGIVDEAAEDDDAARPPPSKKKRKNKGGQAREKEQPIPEPYLVDESLLNVAQLEKVGRRFRQYSRLTVSMNDPDNVHTFFNDPLVKKFDIVAVRPANEDIMSSLIRKADRVDLICFDVKGNENAPRPDWLRRPKLCGLFVAEGVSFEMSYSPVLRDSLHRREALSLGRNLLHCTRNGRNVVLTSGAENMLDLRGTFDALNMTLLWGVENENARPLLSGNPHALLLRAESKRTIKGALLTSAPADIPARFGKKEEALKRLLAVPEFRAQIEEVDDAGDRC